MTGGPPGGWNLSNNPDGPWYQTTTGGAIARGFNNIIGEIGYILTIWDIQMRYQHLGIFLTIALRNEKSDGGTEDWEELINFRDFFLGQSY